MTLEKDDTRMRCLLALCAVGPLLSVGPLHAEGKPLPPPASTAVPPVELRVGLTDGKATCAPAEMPLPAATDIVMHVVSTADRPVVITMQGQFEKGRVEHSDGDLTHVASEKGYTIKAHGKGTLKLRSLPAGEYPFACTSTADESRPFEGKVVTSRPAG